ncbi:MAG TPA: hypothetical protein VJR05_04520 [Acidimicrobiia bacterium]|nr:hypothetical protein [Acidimicrobiia bacterium]
MVCLACRRLNRERLCSGCSSQLRPGPDRLIGRQLRARAAFVHTGPARALVHNFKYRGIESAGLLLAEAMAPLLPQDVALLPLPRVDWRLLRYGIAPAPFLAEQLSRLTGLPVLDLLTVPPFAVDQARRSRNRRRAPMFSLRGPPPPVPLVLIDDVVTTGGTLTSARKTLGESVAQAVTATATLR